MMNSKVMIGKDVIEKLNFEQYFNNCKSVLVLYDLQGNICDAKYKIKKTLPKTLKVVYYKIKASEYVELNVLNECAQLALNNQIDLIIACGGEVACNMGKALKYLLESGSDKFEGNLHCYQNQISDKNNDNILNKAESSENSNCKVDNELKNKDVKLICVAVASGDHQNLLTGEFEILDKQTDAIYRLNKQQSIANTIMLDTCMFDKMSDIAKLGSWLGTVIMALIAIANIQDSENKVNAMAAIDILSVEKLALVDLASAEMYAGYDFLALKNNLLNDFILSVKKLTNAKYSLILVLTMKKNILDIVNKICEEDINLLGTPFAIKAGSKENWKEEICKVIQGKIEQYLEDKDVPNQLNAIGINSKQLENIFDEMTLAFGESENLSKLKDIVYSNY